MLRTLCRQFYTSQNAKLTKKVVLGDGSVLMLRETQSIQPVTELPPRVRTYPNRSTLTQEQIQQVKLLRKTDPDVNTVLQLAKKFNTFPGFIMSITQCPSERKQRLKAEAIEKFNALPVSKKKRSIDRLRRKETW